MNSYVKSSLIGAGIGGALGAGVTKLALRKKPNLTSSQKKKLYIRNTAIGAVAGAGVGLGVQYGKNRYDDWTGKTGFKGFKINVSDYQKGDVISYQRNGYQHYGVVVDDKGNTIEYTTGDNPDPSKARVVRTNIKDVYEGNKVELVRDINPKFTPDEIVARAEKHIGSNLGGYNLANNNCEHFVREVVSGEKKSTQVEKARKENKLVDTMIKFGRYRKTGDVTSLFSAGLLTDIQSIATKRMMRDMHSIRKDINNPELGAMSHWNKYRTGYMAAGGSLIGAGAGLAVARSKYKKIVRDNPDMSETERRQLKRKMLGVGAAIGAGSGAILGGGTSMAMDTIAGKALRDKALYTKGIDLGTSYRNIGKGFRGLYDEDKIDNVASNWKKMAKWQLDSLI